MAALVDKAPDYDIELINNQLYLYRPERINTTNSAQLEHLIIALFSIKDSLEKQTNAYKDERSINPTEIHITGKVLKDTRKPLTIMAWIGVIGSIILILMGNASLILLYLAIVAALGGFFVWPFSK